MNFHEKYNKEVLEKLIFTENKTYIEIGKIFGVSDTYIKKVANRLGISLPKRKLFPKNFIPHNKGKSLTIICENCGMESKTSHNKQKYCSLECNTEHRLKSKYDYYLRNPEEFKDYKSQIAWLKKHILIEQENKCQICGINNFWNEKNLNFVLDHIDGNAYNNVRENLRLICHNCDSQLETYKSKNKNSARKDRYLLNYKNLS